MRKIIIEVEVPDHFDDVEDRWELERAAQEWITENFEEDE
jgi:hypothetical protein